MRLRLEAKRADGADPEPITMDMEFAQEGGEGPTPYEVLLHAALVGDASRFTRQDGIEECWRVVQPLLDAPPPVQSYAPGTWGPEAAAKIVAGECPWHEPWIGQLKLSAARRRASRTPPRCGAVGRPARRAAGPRRRR